MYDDSYYKLVADDAATEDYFGASVAIAGAYAVVGANGKDYAVVDANGNVDVRLKAGSAYVFFANGDGSWTQVAKLTADDAAANRAVTKLHVAFKMLC